MLRRATLLALALLASSCSNTARTAAPRSMTRVETAPSQEAAEASEASATATAREPGVIPRDELDALLAQGPGALLARAEVEPHRKKGAFVGFAIIRFTAGPPEIVDLRPGDVILEVNGQTIERPEELIEVLEGLKTADRLRIIILRQGRKLILEHPIH